MRESVLSILFLLMAAMCSAQRSAYELLKNQNHDFAEVRIPSVPRQMSFAGERVPLEYNDVAESFQREMLVTIYMHSKTSLTLLKTKRYFHIIEPILKEYDIPNDFKYLCCVESGLDEDAVSAAGAGGLWQFMSATAKSYGLVVDSGIDERYNIEKATVAACEMLKELYAKFGSWTMAAAAYNLGAAGVARRLEQQNNEDLYYDAYFPLETRRYIFRILSFKELIENGPEKYGYRISHGDYYRPLSGWREIEVGGTDINWATVAAENGTTYKMLRALNNWIRDYTYKNTRGYRFVVRIPDENFRKR